MLMLLNIKAFVNATANLLNTTKKDMNVDLKAFRRCALSLNNWTIVFSSMNPWLQTTLSLVFNFNLEKQEMAELGWTFGLSLVTFYFMPCP